MIHYESSLKTFRNIINPYNKNPYYDINTRNPKQNYQPILQSSCRGTFGAWRVDSSLKPKEHMWVTMELSLLYRELYGEKTMYRY